MRSQRDCYWAMMVYHSAVSECGHIPALWGLHAWLSQSSLSPYLYHKFMGHNYSASWHTGCHYISFFGKCKAISWSLCSRSLHIHVDCMNCRVNNPIRQTCHFPLQQIKTASEASQVFADSESAIEKYQTLLFRVRRTVLFWASTV